MKIKIVAVDDDELVVLDLLKTILKTHGFRMSVKDSRETSGLWEVEKVDGLFVDINYGPGGSFSAYTGGTNRKAQRASSHGDDHRVGRR